MDVEETIAALDRGDVRVAEKIDGDWRVNEGGKAAILGDCRGRKGGRRRGGAFGELRQIIWARKAKHRGR